MIPFLILTSMIWKATSACPKRDLVLLAELYNEVNELKLTISRCLMDVTKTGNGERGTGNESSAVTRLRIQNGGQRKRSVFKHALYGVI